MSGPLRVLLVEDSEADAELLLEELSTGGYEVAATRVDTAEAMHEQLQHGPWDLVVSDYNMPAFSAPAALEMLKNTTHRHTPFIIVSGTVGEDTAVAALKAGASDFLTKGRLSRLVPAVERELREAASRKTQALLEAQLRRAQQLEVIGQLAGGIAHDFNNILTAILGYAEMLLEQIGADKPISSDLREICHAANRGAALTRQLLAFSRKQPMRVGPLNVNEIVIALHQMLLRLLREDIILGLDLVESPPAIVADRSQLEQVIMNLVTNARDAMPNGGSLTLATSVRDQMVTLSVTDSGSGMDEETQRHMFEPFFTTKSVGRGTGLGLATVYGIVQQLDGTIAVSSEVGIGTTFQLSFPATLATAISPDSSITQRVQVHVPSEKYVVLVVDDEPSVRTILCRVLSRHAYQVLEAPGPNEALEICRSHSGPIDLVVSDLVMPDMNGPEMVMRIRATRDGVPVLYVSGYVDAATFSRLSVHDHDLVLKKPFSASELLERVRLCLAPEA
jgi:signal transduction histidine kinase